MFESGAILLYLGEKTGKFLPKPLIERIPVYEWLMWQMGGFGPMPGQVHHFIALENEQDRAYGLKRYMAETRRLYGVLDRRLDGREFVAGDLSVADFAILGWAWRHPRHKVELSDFPNVKRWYETLMARPAEAGHGGEAGLIGCVIAGLGAIPYPQRPLVAARLSGRWMRGSSPRMTVGLTSAAPRAPSAARGPASTVPISQRCTTARSAVRRGTGDRAGGERDHRVDADADRRSGWSRARATASARCPARDR